MAHGPQVLVTNAEELDRFLVAPVTFAASVERQPSRRCLHAFRPHIEAAPGVPGHGERRECRHRPATHEQAHAVAREADQLFEPVDDLSFDVNRRMIAARATGVHRRCQGVGEHADGHRVVVDPSVEPRVSVPERKWGDFPLEGIQNAIGCFAVLRRRRLEKAAWPDRAGKGGTPASREASSCGPR